MSRPSKAAATEIEQRLAAIEYARGSIAHLAPGQNLADELIEDRRAETHAQEAGGANELPSGES